MLMERSVVNHRRVAYTLAAVVEHSNSLKQVYKRELQVGDWLQVTTRNSTYSIRVLSNGCYSVSGGWFDRMGLSPFPTRIAGCTWGGSSIKVNILAACGLRLEFGNRVLTTTIQRVVLYRFGGKHLNN
jgi:hypothetical protein